MAAFAIYRMPHQCGCTLIRQTTGDVAEFDDYAALGDACGFAVAPFAIDSAHPVVVIAPQSVEQFADASEISDALASDIDAICRANYTDDTAPRTSRDDYAEQFDCFHSAVADGRFRKLVLSRRSAEPTAGKAPSALFADACSHYPRMFICLLSAPRCGTWLVSTPELLLECADRRCRTMALAGTMRHAETSEKAWSRKNIREQAIVAKYIRRLLAEIGNDLEEEGPYTVQAGDLAHLRTDFSFTLTDESALGACIARLHPTPAVCGLPKDAARRFILDREHTGRGYYSGFCGPLNIDGRSHLFVSLRCMRLRQDFADLYAGGGIMPDSEENSEWQETRNKMDTMRRLL